MSTKIYINTINIYILKIILFLAPLAVSTKFNYLFTSIDFSAIVIAIAGYASMLNIISNRNFYFNKTQKKVLKLIIIPVIFSIISSLFFLAFYEDLNYNKYINNNFLPRLILLVFNISILANLFLTTNKNKDLFKDFVKSYFYGLLFLALFGVWQLFSFNSGIPFLDLGTRTHVHGIGKNIIPKFNYRITSLADEPSYLAPLLIDLFILSFLFRNDLKIKLIQIISFVLLIFTFSTGGYLNLFVLIPITIFIFKDKIPKNKLPHIYIIISVFVSFIFLNLRKVLAIFAPVIGRLPTIFNINKHVRMFMTLMPFKWVFEHNIINGFFGYGISSYKYLSLTKTLPLGQYVHFTSNNLFGDIVFEIGYFGLFCVLSIMYILIMKFFMNDNKNFSNKLGIILLAHLTLTSIYRGDYMQVRFWFILFSGIYLLNSDKNIKRKNY